jgi:hypothetical protein
MILNRGHKYSKYFSKSEIENMLSDFSSSIEKLALKSGSDLRMGIPNKFPSGLIDALKSIIHLLQ